MMSIQEKYIEKIQWLKRKYRTEGYEVFIEPTEAQLPDFLRELHVLPDMLARKAGDNIVIAVKSKQQWRFSEKLRRLADAVSRHPGWRFEMIWIDAPADEKKTLGKPEIENYLKQSQHLLESDMFPSALLTAWLGLEAAVRYLADIHGLRVDEPLLALGNRLVYEGVISNEQNDFLQQLFSFRNLLVHGFKTPPITRESVEETQKLAFELLAENEQAANQELYAAL